MADKPDKVDKSKKPVVVPQKFKGGISKWWRETIGELRRVSWPTFADARRLTVIVLMVMAAMSALLGFLDFLFSFVIGKLVAA